MYRNKAIFMLMVVLLLLAFAALFLSLAGCSQASRDVIEPKHVYDPPASAPSPTPSIQIATTQSNAAEEQAQLVYNHVAILTPENVVVEKPKLSNEVAYLWGQIKAITSVLVDSMQKSTANDTAVKALTAQVVQARKDVVTTEDTMAKHDAAAAKQHEEDTAKAKSQVTWFCIGLSSLGVVMILAGGAAAVMMPAGGKVGLLIASGGGLVFALGFAGIFLGMWLAIGAVTLLAVLMIAAVVLVILKMRTDGQSIAQGIAQAQIAGANTVAALQQHLNMAMTPGAVVMVKAETT